MKKKLILAGIIGLISTSLIAQEKKELRKEVKLEEVNGEKQLVIITTENGIAREEVYTGAEADEKLKELEYSIETENAEIAEHKEVKKEIKVEVDENGEKTVTIITTENGNVDEQIFKGPEADKKLKELEEGNGEMRVIIEKEVIKE